MKMTHYRVPISLSSILTFYKSRQSSSVQVKTVKYMTRGLGVYQSTTPSLRADRHLLHRAWSVPVDNSSVQADRHLVACIL